MVFFCLKAMHHQKKHRSRVLFAAEIDYMNSIRHDPRSEKLIQRQNICMLQFVNLILP